MRIFKFGGASVKDADGVKNVFDVLQKTGHEDVFIVISAKKTSCSSSSNKSNKI